MSVETKTTPIIETKKRAANLGTKIDNSHVVWQVTKLMFDKTSDNQISKLLKERYDFSVSCPNIAAFRKNYYAQRLIQLKKESKEFQERQTGKIRSFIDESLSQSASLKEHIRLLEENAHRLHKKLQYTNRFQAMFEQDLELLIDTFSEDDIPDLCYDTEKFNIAKILAKLPENGKELIHSYLSGNNVVQLTKQFLDTQDKLLKHRESLMKIHEKIFKGYKNFSIMQEITTVFERYNGLLVEEFFPDRKTMDEQAYYRVRKKILALFDEFQVRYQGVDAPTKTVYAEAKREDVEDMMDKLKEEQEIVEQEANKKQDLTNRKMNTSRKQARNVKKQKLAKINKQNRIPGTYVTKPVAEQITIEDIDKQADKQDVSITVNDNLAQITEVTDDLAQIIMDEQETVHAQKIKATNLQNLFRQTMSDQGDSENKAGIIMNDLDSKKERIQKDNE